VLEVTLSTVKGQGRREGVKADKLNRYCAVKRCDLAGDGTVKVRMSNDGRNINLLSD